MGVWMNATMDMTIPQNLQYSWDNGCHKKEKMLAHMYKTYVPGAFLTCNIMDLAILNKKGWGGVFWPSTNVLHNIVVGGLVYLEILLEYEHLPFGGNWALDLGDLGIIAKYLPPFFTMKKVLKFYKLGFYKKKLKSLKCQRWHLELNLSQPKSNYKIQWTTFMFNRR